MKQGRLICEPGKPLQFCEATEIDPPPSTGERGVGLIGDSIKAYRIAARDLLIGKYACYAEFVPQHFKNPCNTTVVRCRDGVFVRYDAATETEAKLRVTALDESLVKVAPNLSDFLIHFGVKPEDVNLAETGLALTMAVVDSAGAQRESVDYRLAIFTAQEFPNDADLPKPPSRPPYLLAITNELMIELGGVIVPADIPQSVDRQDLEKFLAIGRLQLQVGWLAIEIYPLLKDEYWQSEYAPNWAELDILAIAAQHNLRESHLSALDSRAETRRQYTALLAQFESLLQGPEEPVHQFLREHAELISPTSDKHWSKVPFGGTKSDFVFREPHNDYELVEIEAPDRQLFRKDGQQHAELTHAINQTMDWVRYIEDNKRTVEDELGLSGISTNPRRLVVIGRSKSLTEENRRKLTTIQNDQPKLRIMTYDDLLAGTRANLERILGPMGFIGQNANVYFYR
jgi:hypothetical protein